MILETGVCSEGPGPAPAVCLVTVSSRELSQEGTELGGTGTTCLSGMAQSHHSGSQGFSRNLEGGEWVKFP